MLSHHNRIWPQNYHASATPEAAELLLAIPPEEMSGMAARLRAVLADPGCGGAAIVDPSSGAPVATAAAEALLQPDATSPLRTPALLALQGAARLEREAAKEKGAGSEEFRGGQYLCTGYDAYLGVEPGFSEAMSLMHARVRRVVFGRADARGGGLGGSTARERAVHSLPDVNHRYRVFKLEEGGGGEGGGGEGGDEEGEGGGAGDGS
jgi:tRNA(Arg) A34 adenosine deaminase TadA